MDRKLFRFLFSSPVSSSLSLLMMLLLPFVVGVELILLLFGDANSSDFSDIGTSNWLLFLDIVDVMVDQVKSDRHKAEQWWGKWVSLSVLTTIEFKVLCYIVSRWDHDDVGMNFKFFLITMRKLTLNANVRSCINSETRNARAILGLTHDSYEESVKEYGS